MSNLFYSGLAKKALRTGNFQRPINEFSFLTDEKINFELFTDKEIIEGYCSDLMKLLQEDDLQVMISGIFQVHNQLAHLAEEKSMQQIPSLDDFFRQLSPLFLQVVWENIDQDSDQFKLFKKWKEAIRISLEEELYHWQERSGTIMP